MKDDKFSRCNSTHGSYDFEMAIRINNCFLIHSFNFKYLVCKINVTVLHKRNTKMYLAIQVFSNVDEWNQIIRYVCKINVPLYHRNTLVSNNYLLLYLTIIEDFSMANIFICCWAWLL